MRKAIDQKNEKIKKLGVQAKALHQSYFPTEIAESSSWPEAGTYSINLLPNGPIVKKERAAILSSEYPEIEKAYKLVNNLRNSFNQTKV